MRLGDAYAARHSARDVFSFRLPLYACQVKRLKNFPFLLGIRSAVRFSGNYRRLTRLSRAKTCLQYQAELSDRCR